jgi:hypothetical protein
MVRGGSVQGDCRMKARMVYRILVVVGLCCLCGCGKGNGGSTPSRSGDFNRGSDAAVGNETCASDPLHTGLVVRQTGVDADAYDCEILKYSTQFNEPDPMIFKAIIYVESRFDYTAVGCQNVCSSQGCALPSGWSTDACGCCGLMQSIAPTCSYDNGKFALLANGQPDMVTDPASPDWPGSVFNPDNNIKAGVQTASENRTRMKENFPGCTEEQYTLMSIGEFNSYGSTQSCTKYNSDYTTAVLDEYHVYSAAAGYSEHAYP